MLYINFILIFIVHHILINTCIAQDHEDERQDESAKKNYSNTLTIDTHLSSPLMKRKYPTIRVTPDLPSSSHQIECMLYDLSLERSDSPLYSTYNFFSIDDLLSRANSGESSFSRLQKPYNQVQCAPLDLSLKRNDSSLRSKVNSFSIDAFSGLQKPSNQLQCAPLDLSLKRSDSSLRSKVNSFSINAFSSLQKPSNQVQCVPLDLSLRRERLTTNVGGESSSIINLTRIEALEHGSSYPMSYPSDPFDNQLCTSTSLKRKIGESMKDNSKRKRIEMDNNNKEKKDEYESVDSNVFYAVEEYDVRNIFSDDMHTFPFEINLDSLSNKIIPCLQITFDKLKLKYYEFTQSINESIIPIRRLIREELKNISENDLMVMHTHYIRFSGDINISLIRIFESASKFNHNMNYKFNNKCYIYNKAFELIKNINTISHQYDKWNKTTELLLKVLKKMTYINIISVPRALLNDKVSLTIQNLLNKIEFLFNSIEMSIRNGTTFTDKKILNKSQEIIIYIRKKLWDFSRRNKERYLRYSEFLNISENDLDTKRFFLYLYKNNNKVKENIEGICKALYDLHTVEMLKNIVLEEEKEISDNFLKMFESSISDVSIDEFLPEFPRDKKQEETLSNLYKTYIDILGCSNFNNILSTISSICKSLENFSQLKKPISLDIQNSVLSELLLKKKQYQKAKLEIEKLYDFTSLKLNVIGLSDITLDTKRKLNKIILPFYFINTTDIQEKKKAESGETIQNVDEKITLALYYAKKLFEKYAIKELR